MADLEFIVSGSARCAAHMPYNSFRTIPVLITINLGTVSDINILQIGKMCFIKHANPLKYLPAVHRCPSTGCKNLSWLQIFCTGSVFSKRICPSQCTVIIADIIQFVAIMVLHHPCTT